MKTIRNRVNSIPRRRLPEATALRFAWAALLTGVCTVLSVHGAHAQQGQQDQELGDPARPQMGQTATEPISIDFVDAELSEVVKQIGAQTGRNFELEPNIGTQRVTIIGHHDVPAEMALGVLQAILSSRGLTMVETLEGNLIKIVQTQQAPGVERLPIETGMRSPEAGYDHAVHVIRVRYARVEEVMSVLESLGFADTMRLVSYNPTNTLVVSGSADGVSRVYKMLEALDLPGTESSVEIFVLEYERAEALQEMIEQVLLEEGAPTPGAPTTPQQRRIQVRAGATPGAQIGQAVGTQEEVLRMVADERLNALIAVATPGMMDQVRFLIGQLDTPTPFEQEDLHYVELLNQDAEAVHGVLQAVTGVSPRLGEQQGGAVTGEVQPFEKEVTVEFFEPTNSLVILASPQDFKKLRTLIERMDVPVRSVSVDALIMEVQITDQFQLSVSAAALDEDDFFGLSNSTAIANLITNGPLGLAGPGGTIGVIDGTVEVPTPDGGTLEVPNVPLLLQAIETLTDVEVLSQPNLLVQDNKSAYLNVGQEIPIISTLSDVNDQTGFQSRSRVNRRNTGVILEVTPQINEGDYISLNTRVEVSAPVVSGIGIDPNETGATIDQSIVENEVIIRDGQTGIIGGLISEGRTKSVSQVPWLGDIPLLGWLFRAKSNNRNKQNLVVLLTPHIVREGRDLDRLTEYRVNEFYQSAFDDLFGQGGFIQKIKTKHYYRNEYHPTDRYNPNRGGARDFSRGHIP